MDANEFNIGDMIKITAEERYVYTQKGSIGTIISISSGGRTVTAGFYSKNLAISQADKNQIFINYRPNLLGQYVFEIYKGTFELLSYSFLKLD